MACEFTNESGRGKTKWTSFGRPRTIRDSRATSKFTLHPKVMSSRILVADDSSVVRRHIRSAIERRTNWVVYEAEHGGTAVLMVSTHKPHLVILDLSMPVMNGLEAAQEISRIAPGLPMIMFTMHQGEALVKAALKVGIQHVFVKSDGFGDHVFQAMNALLVAAA